MKLYIPNQAETLYLSQDWEFLLKNREGNKRLLGALVNSTYIERIRRSYWISFTTSSGQTLERLEYFYRERPDLGIPVEIKDFSYWGKDVKDSVITLPKNTALKIETIKYTNKEEAAIQFKIIESRLDNLVNKKFWLTLKEIHNLHYELSPILEKSSSNKNPMASIRAKR